MVDYPWVPAHLKVITPVPLTWDEYELCFVGLLIKARRIDFSDWPVLD